MNRQEMSSPANLCSSNCFSGTVAVVAPTSSVVGHQLAQATIKEAHELLSVRHKA
jgi:hypothetical protein